MRVVAVVLMAAAPSAIVIVGEVGGTVSLVILTELEIKLFPKESE